MLTLKIEGMAPLLSRLELRPAVCSATCCGTSPAPSEAVCLLSPLGEAMRTAWLTLPQRFPNISIIDSPEEYVIMPEHFHGILYVTGYMQEHLSDIIRLFKARVSMSYRQLLIEGQVRPVGQAVDWLTAYHALAPALQSATQAWISRQLALLYSATRCGTQGDSAPFKITPSGHRAKQGFLFASGYTDSLLLDDNNLDGHRQYILDNPKSRLQRTSNRIMLQVNRMPIDTAVTIPALEGYLRRECPPRDVTAEKLQSVRSLLLCSAARRIICHSYGNRTLLERCLLPVVCHRKDALLFSRQKARCLQAATDGAIMVSAAISVHEREILTAVQAAGYPVIKIEDNGFPEIYHPSQERIDLCDSGKLLIVTPWQYHYRHKDEAIYVAYCKTMNCISQALCHQKDTWWKE